MKMQHFVWIMAQVPPCEAVIMSKATIFPKETFLIRHILVFRTNRLCWLSLKSPWVNLVRASVCAVMSSRPVEETKTAPKWLYQWKTKHAHLALRRWRLAIFCYHGTNSPLCPGKIQGTAAEPPRWNPWPNICAAQPLSLFRDIE